MFPTVRKGMKFVFSCERRMSGPVTGEQNGEVQTWEVMKHWKYGDVTILKRKTRNSKGLRGGY
jgi:hypothetical protein